MSFRYFDDLCGTDDIIAFASIVTAIFVTIVAVGVQHKGAGVNAFELWPSGPIKFHKAFLSVTNIIFAYGRLIPPTRNIS